MNAYRIALILCRAVAAALWWSAGIRFVSLAIIAIVAMLDIGGAGSFPVFPLIPLPLPSILGLVPLVIAAGFLQIFTASLAASMTGGGAFESDSIASRRALDASEKLLGNAGAGLFLLFFGASSALPLVLNGAYMLLFDGFGSAATSGFTVYNLISNALPAILQCIVGFVLAFRLGLRRLIKSP